METLLASSLKRAAEDEGQRITRDVADYLISGFKKKFPNEKPGVFISRETIMKAVAHLDNISGIRFMYGYESVKNSESTVLSRVLLLIPCSNSSTDQIPNSIILPEGYITHTGVTLGFEKSKQVLYNHAVHFSRYFPGLDFNKIMRGTFFGINSLMSMLNIKDCVGVNFYFGYDDEVSDVPRKNKPVFEPINSRGESLDTFDLLPPCPPWCGFIDIFNVQNG
ncbi:MAG: hypothetical protein ACXVAU_13075 [Mucilaginibacter sp.]